jgi:hypothetical protein
MAIGEAMGEYERTAARNAIIIAAFARDWHAGRWIVGEVRVAQHGARDPWPTPWYVPCLACARRLARTARRRVQRHEARRAERLASGQGLLW